VANAAKLLSSRKIHKMALVENENLLGSGTRVRPGARILGDVRIGENALIDSNAVIYGPAKLGRRTYVGPNCVIGFWDSAELGELLKSDRVTGKKSVVLGDNCIVRAGTSIYTNVKIGDEVSFGHNVLVREGVTIGEKTKLGTNVVVDGKSIIGSRVSIQTGVYICTYSTVEDSVFLGPCCVFTNDKYVTQKPFNLIGPTVKKGASIGANALLFPGITVGEGAVVGSQAMVNSDVPSRTIFVGIPAKKIAEVPADWRSSLFGD
jgi:acetyltransferase-like isoleucine patch superfamily enzyme